MCIHRLQKYNHLSHTHAHAHDAPIHIHDINCCRASAASLIPKGTLAMWPVSIRLTVGAVNSALMSQDVQDRLHGFDL